jgi:hypothetical protein
MISITFLNRKQFKTLYGARTYAIAKNIETIFQKKMKIDEHIIFLKKCKQNNVIPKGLYIKNTTHHHKNDQLLNKTMQQLRNNLLDFNYKQQRFMNIELNTQLSILKLYLEDIQPHRLHDNDLKWINKHDKLPRQKLKKTHENKLKSLINKKQQLNNQIINNPNISNVDTSNVINNSSIYLNNEHLQVLSKGLKFVPTASSFNLVDIITNTEKSLYSIPKLIKKAAIAEISNFMTKWRKPSKSNINKYEIKLLKEIKSNPDIIVVPADKGGKIVVMDRGQYITKIEEQLNDTNIYEVTNDPTNKIKNKICRIANKLFKKNRITQHQKYHFSSIENLATVRGQPKIHKQGTPMRLITCTRSTITSNISKFTLNIIHQLRETIENCVTNTTEFITKINQIKLEDDDNLASLDVKDLFTNIPISKSIDIVIERIGYSETFCQSTLTKSDIKELLIFCLQNSSFTFNNKFYRQINGLPMGNILSPLISDLYMDEYIKNNLKKVNGKLYRYVDDLFIITKMDENEIKLYVNELNSLKETIKFTHEFETNKQLNYLDTTVTRNTLEKRLDIKWFRKDTASDRLLHFESGHNKSIKLNIIKNMTMRIINTTMDNDQQQEDLITLKQMLIKSKYPNYMIENSIQTSLKECTNNITTNNNKKQTDNKKNVDMEFSLSLPYVHGMEVLKRKLEKLKIKLYFSYPKKINSLVTSNIKPPSKSVVYQINCECGSVYNGETKVGLKTRSKQHNALIEKDEKNASSELVQHHHQKRWQCMFDPNSAFTIDSDTDFRRRRIKEAVYSTLNDSINKHDLIDNAWNNILHKESTTIKENIKFKMKMNSLKQQV